MAYTLDFLKYEFMQFARNPFLWIAQLFCFFTIKSEASHFLGKKHYLFSALIQSGSISVSQEMIARAVIFPLSALLLLMTFAFAGYFRAFLDNRYAEIVLNKTLKTSKLVCYKLVASFTVVILVSFIATFIFTWFCLSSYKIPFEPGYFTSLYAVYLLIPLFFWLVLSFILAVLFSDAKILYPVMLIVWFINLFPTKYSLLYSNWTKLNLGNPLADVGLWANRCSYLVIAVIIWYIGVRLLEIKRRDLFRSDSPETSRGRNETIDAYEFKDSKLVSLLASYKINLSWKFIFGVVVFAALPPMLNEILLRIFNNMITTAEILTKVLQTGEIYLTLGVLLYATYSLNVEYYYNASELISCRPDGLKRLYGDKLKLLFLFSIVMALAFYLSTHFFVAGIPLFIYAKIILPATIFYLVLPFAVIMVVRGKGLAFLICYTVWAVNLIFRARLPVYLNTFAPVQATNPMAYNINRLELIALSLILLGLFMIRKTE